MKEYGEREINRDSETDRQTGWQAEGQKGHQWKRTKAWKIPRNGVCGRSNTWAPRMGASMEGKHKVLVVIYVG